MTDPKCETKQCIMCSAENCMYHTVEDTCSAGKISVGHRDACKSSETCCDTFSAKNCG